MDPVIAHATGIMYRSLVQIAGVGVHNTKASWMCALPPDARIGAVNFNTDIEHVYKDEHDLHFARGPSFELGQLLPSL